MNTNEPIRVLHIVPNMQAGGLETFIMNVYRTIDRSKFQFDFLVHYQEPDFYDNEIKQLGGKIYYSTFRNDNNIVKYIKNINEFYKQHHEYKIIHCHMESIGYLNFIIAKKNGVKVRISHSHSDRYGCGIKGLMKRFSSLPLKYISTKRLACSKAAGKRLFRKKSYTIIPNAIDTKKFKFNHSKRSSFRSQHHLSDQQLVIGHIGRFDKEKNHTYLLKIFQQVLQRKPDSILLLAGKGKLKTKIKKLSRKLGINNSIRFLNTIHDTSTFYSSIDILLMPSIFEGIPITSIEAQISGAKCILSDTITHEVAVTNNVKFIPISPKDLNLWVSEILQHGNKRSTQLNHIIDQYDIKNTSRQLESIYTQCLRGRAGVEHRK